MPKLKLLILDANVVIRLHEMRLWQPVLSCCEILLARIVAEREVQFQKGDEYDEEIDLAANISAGEVQVFDIKLTELQDFRKRFDSLYLEQLDDGEAESLAYLLQQPSATLISSADAIVYRVLGNLNRGDQGLSLEEVLQKIGLGKKLEWPYSKAFREKYTRDGEQDHIQGRGCVRG